MDSNFLIVVDGAWLLAHGKHPHRLADQALCPIGANAGHLLPGCSLLVKFRDRSGAIVCDTGAKLESLADNLYIKSPGLAAFLSGANPSGQLVLLFFEGATDEATCITVVFDSGLLGAIEDEDRLETYGIPPTSAVVVDTDHLVGRFREAISESDRELLATHVDRFLEAPHIITALFTHLMSLRTEDNIRFPIQVKKIAEQLRVELERNPDGPRIHQISKSHLDLWAEVQGRRFAFLDGGAARITALPGVSPMALRVGIYSVRPGVEPDDERETWRMRPFVVADILDPNRRLEERFDRRRLQEAARYTLEALAGLQHLKEFRDTAALFIHGPLVNQFTQYDDAPPNSIPYLSRQFLSEHGIERDAVVAALRGIPSDRGELMWNHFMTVYGYLMLLVVNETTTPVLGVVERPTGRAVTRAVLQHLEAVGAFTQAYSRRVQEILEQYDITDDFLFGCMLREGEYLTPIPVTKNPFNRAREKWWPVVRQYPNPLVILLKSEETNFPFRVEINGAALRSSDDLARFLYHTARLLPRYAFPVGLDIADKYAKVPDWLSRGVSAEFSATVLRQAMKTGDARLVTQVRLFLARGPRDFFFRPSANL